MILRALAPIMLTAFLASLALAQTVKPVVAAPARTYVQSLTRPDGTMEIQTAARRLTSPGKPDVWLVGAIHVGSRDYYTRLQELLDAQSAVFYEGVKPGSAKAAPADPKSVPATPVYKVLSDAIGLDFQLADIRYDRPGWRNVDLSWDELDRLNKAASGGKPSQYDQIRTFLDPKSPQAKMMATMLGSATPGMKEAIKILIMRTAGGATSLGLEPATQKVVLQARNRAVVDELTKTVAAPDAPKSIAVFYGALHMGELEKDLTRSLGYRAEAPQWFVAATADPKKLDEPGKSFLNMLEKSETPRKKG